MSWRSMSISDLMLNFSTFVLSDASLRFIYLTSLVWSDHNLFLISSTAFYLFISVFTFASVIISLRLFTIWTCNEWFLIGLSPQVYILYIWSFLFTLCLIVWSCLIWFYSNRLMDPLILRSSNMSSDFWFFHRYFYLFISCCNWALSWRYLSLCSLVANWSYPFCSATSRESSSWMRSWP